MTRWDVVGVGDAVGIVGDIVDVDEQHGDDDRSFCFISLHGKRAMVLSISIFYARLLGEAKIFSKPFFGATTSNCILLLLLLC